MCKRRGGWKYAYVEMRFQRQLQKLGYIGILMMMTNICIRLVTRLVPEQPERMDLQEISTKIVAHSYVGRFIRNIEK